MTYPGGKNGSGVAQAIINQIPPHRIYIEAFLGSGAIMRTKKPAEISCGIDSNKSVIYRWNSGEWRLPPGAIAVLGDAISALKFREYQGGEFVYCDPPYLFDVRSSNRDIYENEFGTPEQHAELISVLRSLPCRVMLSGYWSELYADLLKDWRTVSFNTTDRGGNLKEEWLWMNYPEPEALHDYRFLGSKFRERERLARFRRRWVARLQRMDQLERLMLSAAIAESSGVAGGIAVSDGPR